MTSNDLSRITDHADGCYIPESACDVLAELYQDYAGERHENDYVARVLLLTVLNIAVPPSGAISDLTCAEKPLEGILITPIVTGANIVSSIKRYPQATEARACYLDVQPAP